MGIEIVIAVVGCLVFGIVFLALMFLFVAQSDEIDHHY